MEKERNIKSLELIGLTKDLGSVPFTHMVVHNCNYSSRDPMLSSGLHGHISICMQNTHSYKIIKSKEKKYQLREAGKDVLVSNLWLLMLLDLYILHSRYKMK